MNYGPEGSFSELFPKVLIKLEKRMNYGPERAFRNYFQKGSKYKSCDEVFVNFCGRTCVVGSLECLRTIPDPRKISFHQVKSNTRSFMNHEKCKAQKL